jgi:UDP-N-acetylglucosamine--N-acetylmuramyl-(pentapeptide) pyrophosphoryl-undecaprenol N-acetylglucosamine transferase
VPAAGIPFGRLILRSLRSAGRDVHLVLDPVRLLASGPQALWRLWRFRPAAVFTTGGYVAIPVLVAARLLGVPALLWEGNVVPGRSVRFVARLASAIAVSFEATCASLGGPGRRCFITGTPIRRLDELDRAEARARFGIPPDARVVLVFGGSQAVRRFSAVVGEAIGEMTATCHVIHVTGEAGHSAALAARRALPADRQERYRPHAFLTDLMLPALAAADLIVGRAGSSTLAEAAALGVPLVVVPYPHAAGHQAANARALVDAGAARVVADEEFDARALLEAVAILSDEPTRAAMSAAARDIGRPGAADACAAIVEALAERRELPAPAAVEQLSRGGER